MKRLAICAIAAVLVIPSGLIAFYKWDEAKNRGSEVGYWGDFNRTSNALAAVPGVLITGAWFNADITLEEFGFDIVLTNQQWARVTFWESSEIRDMSRRRALPALQQCIAEGLAGTNQPALALGEKPRMGCLVTPMKQEDRMRW
ncbi:MAG TPA: hypothetical protein VF773_15690 [Verrucomicrobiae bacterium]